MKFAIVSDFHLGFNDDALEQAKRCLRSACEKADFVVMAGDLFDARVPKQETVHDAVKLFKEFSEKLKSNKIILKEVRGGGEQEIRAAPLLGIYGTHERRAKGLSNIIQVMDDAGLLVNAHARKIIVEKISGAGGGRERACVQAMGGVPEDMAKKAVELLEFEPEPGCFNAFVFHQSVRELIPQDEEALSMADLPAGFDLYVNGHIHWRQELRAGGKTLLIPGSTVVTQMKQNEANPKGYYLYDIERRSAEFVEIPTRPFVYKLLEFNSAQLSEVEKACRHFLQGVAEKYGEEKPLVKLKIGGTLAPGLASANLDLGNLQAEFGGKMFLSVDKQVGVLEFKEKIEELRRLREEKAGARELGMEALKKLLKQKGVDKEFPGSVDELFELLSQGEVDLALEKVLSKQN